MISMECSLFFYRLSFVSVFKSGRRYLWYDSQKMTWSSWKCKLPSKWHLKTQHCSKSSISCLSCNINCLQNSWSVYVIMQYLASFQFIKRKYESESRAYRTDVCAAKSAVIKYKDTSLHCFHWWVDARWLLPYPPDRLLPKYQALWTEIIWNTRHSTDSIFAYCPSLKGELFHKCR